MNIHVPQNETTRQPTQKIGGTLRRLRLEKGFTQKQIASALDVSFQQVQKYEMGQNRLPIEKLLVLKHLYKVPFEDFFEGFPNLPQEAYDRAYYDSLHKRFEAMNDDHAKAKIYKILDILLSS